MIVESKTAPSDKDLWATPTDFFLKIIESLKADYPEFTGFTLDACAMDHNKKVERFISPEQDTLKTDWGVGEFVWMNPPYSNPLIFVERAIEMAQKNFVAVLLPSDTSTKWFAKCAENADSILFLTGKRVSFVHNGEGKKKSGNTKGSIVVIFKPNVEKGSVKTRYIPLNDLAK